MNSKHVPYMIFGMLLGAMGTLIMSHMWQVSNICSPCVPCPRTPSIAVAHGGIAQFSAEALGLSPAVVSQVLKTHWWELPCRGDTESLLPMLKLVYRMDTESPVRDNGVLVDIGANVGQTSSAILAQFGQVDFKAFVRSQGSAEVQCGKAGTQLDAKLFAFEPGRKVGDKLSKHAKERGWEDEGFQLLRIAVGSFDGKAEFRDDGKETGSLVGENKAQQQGGGEEGEGKPSKKDSVYEVEVATVARLHEKYFSRFSDSIFLLKMDCEGFDPLALEGAQPLFAKRKVKFILFEYNKVWTAVTPGILLETVLEKLHKSGYECFFLTPKHLLPISGKFWHKSYEIRQWSNVFCGLSEDPDLQIVLDAFHLAPSSNQLKHYSTYDEYFFHCKGKECAVKNNN